MKKIKIRNNEELEDKVVKSFDMLRTNIEFADSNAKTIVITSAGDREGKSLISFQLACNMATNGKKVLLIMADLRKGVSGQGKDVAGMLDAVSGKAGLNDSVYKTDMNNLFIMFSGSADLPAEKIIKSEAFNSMINIFKNKFDYILFDTAPVLDGVTTSLITKRCDGVVLVMAKEKTAYDVGLSAKEQIELAGGKILGVVLNNTRR
jgi:capsular exopolysaccharide synthesis family protein